MSNPKDIIPAARSLATQIVEGLEGLSVEAQGAAKRAVVLQAGIMVDQMVGIDVEYGKAALAAAYDNLRVAGGITVARAVNVQFRKLFMDALDTVVDAALPLPKSKAKPKDE
jgi:hypothetical protein